MAVNNALSFRFFSSTSSKALIGELAEKLGVSLDKDAIRDFILANAKNVKEDIKKEVSKNFIFLKFDCATRQRTNYIGINARYVNKVSKRVFRKNLCFIR